MSEQSPLGLHNRSSNDDVAFSPTLKASSAPTTTTGTNIASHVSACFQSFDHLNYLMHDPENEYLDQVQPCEISDELGRFRIWAGSMGAHRRGRSSFDYRLRDASHIKRQAQTLLTDLDDALQRTLQILRGDCIPWDRQTVPAVEEMVIESDDESLEGDSELRQLLTSIHETITFLLRLSVAIQNPAPHDHYLNSRKLNTAQIFEKFDIPHVRETFPLAPEAVVKVIGKAISRRREYFKYRESHSKKLSDGMPGDEEGNENEDARTEFRPLSTVASSIPQELKMIDQVLELDADQISDSGLTQTSIATSAEQSQSRKIPPVPQKAKDEETFPCPYCFMLVSVHSRRSWKRHVLKDLQPYTCTFPSCLSSKKLFERRHEWFEHEMQHHRREWICPNGCQTCFESRKDIELHLRDVHYDSISSEQLARLVGICGKSPKMDLETSCVLCGERLMLKQLERHLGKHQKHLALFALPDIAESEDRDINDACSDANIDMPARSSSQKTSSQASDDESDTNEDVPMHKGLEPLHVTSSEQNPGESFERKVQSAHPTEQTARTDDISGEPFTWKDAAPESTPADNEDTEHNERLKKLEELIMQQEQARTDKEAAKKKAAEDAAAAEAEARKKGEEDKLAKLHDLLVAQREEQKARDEAIAAIRAAEKAEADAKAAKDAAEKQKGAQDAAKLLAAAKKAREEAEAKAAEDAKAAKEAHEKALAEAAEELR